MDECQEIKFNDGLNLIIGPNGAGKSNFLEIINQIFHNILFASFNYQENVIASNKINPEVSLKNVLTRIDSNVNLVHNNKSNSNTRQIKIIIGLNDNDKTNLKFLNNNQNELNSLSQTYSNVPFTLPVNISDTDIDAFNEIELLFESLNNVIRFTDATQYNTNLGRFVSIYLQMFNQIQYLIIIRNNEKRSNWAPLKNTFAIIGGYRNYDRIESNHTVGNENNDLQQIKQRMLQETTRSSKNEEPVVFSY
ncbi:MAG: AAA family ATPase, partial [Nitrosopumilaceae archaeon]